MSARIRHFVATKNNPTKDDEKQFVAFVTHKGTYGVYGLEVGDQGTQHLQIYVELKNAMARPAIMKKLFPCHVEQRLGTPKQAAGYCKKGNSPKVDDYSVYFDEPHESWHGFELGEISHQGSRSDLAKAAADVIAGKPMVDIAMENPVTFVRNQQGLKKLRQIMLRPRHLDKLPEVHVFWGPTGTGKTHRAEYGMWPGEKRYVKGHAMGKWFDDYDGEEIIVLNEFRGEDSMGFQFLLDLLDKYPFRVQNKNGSIEIQANRFAITSPLHPKDWYGYTKKDSYDQLKRRMKSITKMTTIYVEDPDVDPLHVDEFEE